MNIYFLLFSSITIGLLNLSPEQLIIATPILSILLAVSIATRVTTRRDGYLPFVDIGMFTIGVTTLYVIYPGIMFIISNSELSVLSDARLYAYEPSPQNLSRVLWWGFYYIASLIIGYCYFRRKSSFVSDIPVLLPRRPEMLAIVLMFLALKLYIILVQIFFGVDLKPSYSDLDAFTNGLPLIVQQFTTKIMGFQSVIDVCIILILVSKFHINAYRYLLIAWISLVLIDTLITLGSRSGVAILLMAWFIAHQRLRANLNYVKILIISILFLIVILTYGIHREGVTGVDTFKLIFTMSNEFQSLFTTTFDLISRREAGFLPSMPWEYYFADFLRIIPQQLLPFDKIDQSEWYLELLGLRGTGQGYMFGVLSEGAVGFGVYEITARGLVLGMILGIFHNWYHKNRSNYWATVLYVWSFTVVYYTYRAGTFYILTFYLTFFLPTFVMIKILKYVLKLASNKTSIVVSP